MTTSAEMPDEIWASNLGGWWSHVTNAATTRYIRADIADELRKSRDHHASTIFIQEARIVSQAAEIAALKAAMRASFDEHGSAPTDCDCSKCTRLAVLLGYLPGEHNHD